MSKTPETDNAATQYILAASDEACYDEPFVDFARTLETQRDEARAEVERLRNALEKAIAREYTFINDVDESLCKEQRDFLDAMETALGIPVVGIPATPTQPEIFEAHGREWYRHAPGDAMPCELDEEVEVLLREEFEDNFYNAQKMNACQFRWQKLIGSSDIEIIGWRPADAPEKLLRK